VNLHAELLNVLEGTVLHGRFPFAFRLVNIEDFHLERQVFPSEWVIHVERYFFGVDIEDRYGIFLAVIAR